MDLEVIAYAEQGRFLSLNVYFLNSTISTANNFTAQLKPAKDLSVTTVVSSLYINAFVFVVLIVTYEVLRRHFPSVYDSRKLGAETPANSHIDPDALEDLPHRPFAWVLPVINAPWLTVQSVGGLDAYFFLRYIRLCARITVVSTFWALVILVPVYYTGGAGAVGWYHVSMANILHHGWRNWVAVAFMYLFSTFCYFAINKEYRHYMFLRTDYLGTTTRHLDPQHLYSVAVENIPMELRSSKRLYAFFDWLFPGTFYESRSTIRASRFLILFYRQGSFCQCNLESS